MALFGRWKSHVNMMVAVWRPLEIIEIIRSMVVLDILERTDEILYFIFPFLSIA
jgi:hypothetical protein